MIIQKRLVQYLLVVLCLLVVLSSFFVGADQHQVHSAASLQKLEFAPAEEQWMERRTPTRKLRRKMKNVRDADGDWSKMDESESVGSQVMDSLNKAMGEMESSSSSQQVTERMLVHSGEITLVTEKDQGERIATQIEALVTSSETGGGYVESKSNHHPDHYIHSLYLTVRISSDRFHGFLAKLQELGCQVTNLSVNSKDVTDSFVDATTRGQTIQASIKSLQALMVKADTVEAVLQIQQELNRLTQEYESNKARANSLQKQANLSTLQIYIQEKTEESRRSRRRPLVSNVATTFLRACEDVSDMFGFLVNCLVYASVMAVSLAIPLWLLYLAYRTCTCCPTNKLTVNCNQF